MNTNMSSQLFFHAFLSRKRYTTKHKRKQQIDENKEQFCELIKRRFVKTHTAIKKMEYY